MAVENPDKDPLGNLALYIVEQLNNGTPPTNITEDLIGSGVEPLQAAFLVGQVDNARRASQRETGCGSIGCGIVLAAIGGVITLGSYFIAQPGGTYIVTTGLFIGGGIAGLFGLFRIASSWMR